jgi:hypothetical protein
MGLNLAKSVNDFWAQWELSYIAGTVRGSSRNCESEAKGGDETIEITPYA